MQKFEKQYDLFNNNNFDYTIDNISENIYINKKVITDWQKNIVNYQSQLLIKQSQNLNQYTLFKSKPDELYDRFNPFDLTPLPLSFWRWPKPTHNGAAIYFVIDKQSNTNDNIILYIGETFSAGKRWKGDHDCKSYLDSYSEILQKADLNPNLNIRFWLDVPINTKERRKLEQKLIQTWLPPFNKETREIWSTPFTS